MGECVRAEPFLVLALVPLGLGHVCSPVLGGLQVARHPRHLMRRLMRRLMPPQPRELVLEIALRRARLVGLRVGVRVGARVRDQDQG